jgi:predicted RecB family nuclease
VKVRDGQILLSPSDLANYLACRHLTALDAAVQRGEMAAPPPYPNAMADIIKRKGDEHEAAFLASLRAEGHEITTIPFEDRDFEAAARATEEAIRGGAEIIYQACLASGGWRGFADFLVRGDDGAYEAWDAKLARRGKPNAVLQLTFYSHELQRIQGVLPERMHVVLGTGNVESYRPAEFAAFYRRARARLEDAVAHPRETYPWKVEHCRICDYWQLCQERWRQDDHLNGIANISRSQIERLTAAGIPTLEALGDAPAGTSIPRLAASTFEALRHQAALQLAARRGPPRYELLEPAERRGLGLLPEPSPGDLFYDIEGDPWWEPQRGLEYLHGITDREGLFTAIWAHDREEERRALEQVIGRFHAALAEHPGMHVYHYGSYDASALKRLTAEHGVLEDELDQLLRREVFVDLYTVTRQAVRISYPSYSIKEVRKFFMEATAAVEGGAEALVLYEQWMEDRDDALLAEIAEYNEEDCLSNLLLRDWLVERRSDAEAQFGVAIPWLSPPEPREVSAEKADAIAGRAELRRELAATEDEALELMGDLLEYHRREARPVWWWFFARGEMTPDELVEDSESIGQLEPDGTVEPVKRSKAYGLRFPVQQHKLDAGDDVYDPATLEKAGEIHELDPVAGTLKLKRGPKLDDVPLPEGLIPLDYFTTEAQQQALVRVGGSLLAGDGRYPHLEKLLRREPPLGGARVQCEGLEALGRLIREVEGSYLFIQGPPGSGKTWTGARLITYLVSVCGKRVGIASQSHKAIHKLLAEIEEDARDTGVSFRGLKKASGPKETRWETDYFESTTKNEDFVDADHDVLAGTAWLFAREELDGSLDYLFIDEAGQTSLADALALGTCAKTLVLLGDPVQLAQVTQAIHPGEAGTSVLAHLLGEGATVAEDMGVFLPLSFRMHPDVCKFVSDVFYEGRLNSDAECEKRTTPLGTGLRYLGVDHAGNSTSSEEEAERIRAEIDRLVAAGMSPEDVMVVAPFNAQVKLLTERLQDGVAVGTVDKFQGQQAPVVFFSMAASSGADAPRGVDFLMSQNRLNVAVSRAQCLAYLVCGPALLDVDCKTVEHMRLANALCRFVELSS